MCNRYVWNKSRDTEKRPRQSESNQFGCEILFLRHEIEKGTESGLRVSPRQPSNINTDSDSDFSYKAHIRMQIIESAPFDLKNIHCFNIIVMNIISKVLITFVIKARFRANIWQSAGIQEKTLASDGFNRTIC